MKNINKNLSRVLPVLTLGIGATLAFDGAAQAQTVQPDADAPPRREGGFQRGGNSERQFGDRPMGDRPMGGEPFGRGRGGSFLVPAPRMAVPTVEEMTEALELTPDQQKKMGSVLNEMQKRINNTLTSEQRTKWEQLRTQPETRAGGPLERREFGGREGRGNGRPEMGRGIGRGGRQGMGPQGNPQGRGQEFAGQRFGGPGMGGPAGGPGMGRPGMGRPGMGEPQRGGRRGMGPQGERPDGGGPEGMRPEGRRPRGERPEGMRPDGMRPERMGPDGMGPREGDLAPQGRGPAPDMQGMGGPLPAEGQPLEAMTD